MAGEHQVSTDIVVRERAEMTVLSNEQLQYIASTEFVPPGLRGNLPAILACVATGRSLGIADMTALRSIHIIDGKATFSAELMVQLVRRQGHSITGDVGEGSATVVGKRADNGDTMTVTWTCEMADRAGLLRKQNWVKYPEAMLWARAASQLCRMLFPDCFSGATYTPEEIGEAETTADGEPVASAPVVVEAVADVKPRSDAQAKKLNVLVGRLRTAGHLTTEQVWAMVGREPVVSDDGELHWSPLRDSLTKQEASDLIELLERDEANTTPAPSEEELLARLLGHAADPDVARAAIEAKRSSVSEAAFSSWLVKQAARVPVNA